MAPLIISEVGREVQLVGLLLAALLLNPIALLAQDASRCRPCDLNWPHLRDPRLNGFVHDAGHAITSVAIAEGLRLAPVSPTWRYVIGTVAWPLVQEWVIDQIKFPRYRMFGGDSFHDLFTYQGAWIVHLVREDEWVWAGLAAVAYLGGLYAWNYQITDWKVSDRYWATLSVMF